MNVVKKAYRAVFVKDMTIYVEVNGRGMGCSFDGGTSFPKKLNGTYATTDPDIQKAVEEHPWFRKTFVLVSEVVVGVAPAPPEKPAETPLEAVDPLAEKEEVYLSPARNAQEAKKELNVKFSVPWSRLKNVRQVNAEAAQRGIQYPNWMTT